MVLRNEPLTLARRESQSALKSLMVIHRLMRETGGPNFVQRLLEAGGSSISGGGGGNFSAAAGQLGMGNATTGMGMGGGGGGGTGMGGGGGGSMGMGMGGGLRGHLLNMDNFIDQTNSDGRCVQLLSVHCPTPNPCCSGAV